MKPTITTYRRTRTMSKSLGRCPSGVSTAADAMVFAVVGANQAQPLLRYLDRVIPIAAVLDAGTSHADIASQLRVSSNCVGGHCQNYNHERHACSLATAVWTTMSPVVQNPPPCAIRRNCVWWKQEGVDICTRCPAVTRRSV